MKLYLSLKNFHRKRVTVLTTTTLYKIVQSELYALGHDHEIVDKEGNLVFFDNDFQVMSKVMSYDNDIETIVDHLFNNMKLNNTIHDQHFKKTFFFRFINREINRQTIESFILELTSTFLQNQDYINRVYTDMEKYILGYSETNDNSNQDSNDLKTSTSKSNSSNTSETTSTGNTTTDNRQARSDLPQNSVNLDVNNSVMRSANENDISRNKQNNNQTNTDEQTSSNETENEDQSESHSSGESNSISKTYQLDQLFKTNNVLERIMNEFDKKCFMQF